MVSRKKIAYVEEILERNLNRREQIAKELKGSYIGWDKEPYTANCMSCEEHGTIEFGDRVQLRLEIDEFGVNWTQILCNEHRWDDLPREIKESPVTAALATFETKGIPTIPITEGGWPTDYNLEQRKELNPWRFEPCNDAVHLSELVSWDDFS